MRFGSLFSGIGGLDLGLEQAGLVVVWQAEVDEACNRVLSHHWPDLENIGDVRTASFRLAGRPERPRTPPDISPADSQPDGGSVDLLCGGFPCTDVSIQGQRAGLAGSESGLFEQFARAAEELCPAWILLENVIGLLTANGGRDFAYIVLRLAELGYQDVSWRVVNSLGFGVPQWRRRVFVIGSAREGAASEVLHEQCGSPGGDLPDAAEDGSGTSSSCSGDYRLRRLTPVEAERTQGFPDRWTEPAGSDTDRWRVLGNAVTVPVARWLGERVLMVEGR